MPYVTRKENSKDVKIYYEVHGQGQPIVFHHGNGNRSSDWRHLGYVDALQDEYQLIFIDLRGYGHSSKFHEVDDYPLKGRIDDTMSVLNELGIEQAHCLGGSFSTSFLFLFAKYYPERFKSYIFLTPGILFTQGSAPDALKISIEAYIEALEEKYGKFEMPFLRETFLANDNKALLAANTGEWFDYHDYIKYINKPSLIYTGELEPINAELKQLATQLPDCDYVEIPEFGHAEAYWRGDVAAPFIKQFIRGLNEN
jgi:pimeloyl-ACP methyl ester carboxylesterase